MNVKAAVLGSPSIITLMVSVDVKPHSTVDVKPHSTVDVKEEVRSCVKVEVAVLGSRH